MSGQKPNVKTMITVFFASMMGYIILALIFKR